MRGSAASAAGKRTIAAHSESWQEGSVQRVVRQDEETRMDVGACGLYGCGTGSQSCWESSLWGVMLAGRAVCGSRSQKRKKPPVTVTSNG